MKRAVALKTRGSRIRKLIANETKSLRKASSKKSPGYGKIATVINKQKFMKWGMNPGTSYAKGNRSIYSK